MSADRKEVEISYASWQDRQLAAIAARVEQILRELREIQPGSAGRTEALALELAGANAESQAAQAREAALRFDLDRTRDKAAGLESQAQKVAGDRDRLEKEVGRLGSEAAASAREAAALRKRVTELETSLSWRITAPLRAITAPLFRALAKPAPQAAAPTPASAAAGKPVTPETASAIEGILPALRGARSIVVIPCAIPFSATLNQRPISCARYLAERGVTVIYVAWQWTPEEPVPQAGEEVYPGVYCLPLYAFQANVERIAAASRAPGAFIETLASAELVEAARPLRAAGYHIHYDIMDDWEEFHRGGEAPWFSAPVEQELVVLADTVTAVSEKLARKFEHLRGDIVQVRNGYQPTALDCEHFLAARSEPANPKIVGYFGHFSDAWFDWDTVLYAAGQRPGVVFELIGWGISDATRARAERLSNIRLPGIVPQKELHRYARKWWTAMIPFRPSEVSAAVDPLKVYEYLHFGLHTVVTGITGIADYPLVRFAKDRENFVAALDGLPDRPPEEELARTAEFLKQCTWEERFGHLHRLLLAPAGLASLYRQAG